MHIKQASHVYVGYSGGVDSQVLLHLAKQITEQHDIPIKALHVHHGLQKDADAFANHCRNTTQDWQISLITENITHLSVHDSNLEAKARHARYQAFTKHIKEPQGALLLLGHHADDQLETQLFHLVRKTGLHALCGMPAQRAHTHFHILRPFLSTPKAALLDYAKAHNLSWIEDPSNKHMHFSRNRIRHTLLPLVKQDPVLIRALQHYRALASLGNRLNRAMATIDANSKDNPTWPQTLSLENWQRMDDKRQLNMLRFWLSMLSHEQPPIKHLKTLRAQLQQVSSDQQLQWTHNQHQVRLYQHTLYWLPKALPTPPKKPIVWNDWSKPITLPDGKTYSLAPDPNGFALENHATISIDFFHNVTKIKCPNRAHSIKVGQWFAEHSIPPWDRNYMPLFHVDNVCISIGEHTLSSNQIHPKNFLIKILKI